MHASPPNPTFPILGEPSKHRLYLTPFQVLESQLKPIRDQLAVCVGQQVPDFNTFQVWMTERIIITANEKGGPGPRGVCGCRNACAALACCAR